MRRIIDDICGLPFLKIRDAARINFVDGYHGRIHSRWNVLESQDLVWMLELHASAAVYASNRCDRRDGLDSSSSRNGLSGLRFRTRQPKISETQTEPWQEK